MRSIYSYGSTVSDITMFNPHWRGRLTISPQSTMSPDPLLHFLELHLAMHCQRPPAKQYNKHKRTNSLRSKLIHSLRLSFKHLPTSVLHPDRVEPPHDHAVGRYPARLSTREHRVKACDERCKPEIHGRPSAGEELGRSPEGVAERRQHT